MIRETETQPLESPDRFSVFLEYTPLAVIEWTPQFEIVNWNLAAEKIFGYPKHDVIGRYGLDLIWSATVRDQIHQTWQQLWQQSKPLSHTSENITQTGNTIDCEWYNIPFLNEQGQVIRVASWVQNVTEQKLAEADLKKTKIQLEHCIETRTQELTKALAELKETIAQLKNEIKERQQIEASLQEREEQYRTVVDNLKDVIFQTDIHGNWTFLNPAWSDITEFAIADTLGHSFLDYVHPEDRQKNWQQFQDLIQSQNDSYRHEIRYRTASGSYRWMEVFAQLTLDWDGNIIGTCGTLYDSTERHVSEGKLRKQLEALSELAQSQAIDQGNLTLALQEITETVSRTLEVERCSVWRYNEDCTQLECLDLYEQTPQHHNSAIPLVGTQYPNYFAALEVERIIAVSDAHSDPRTQDCSPSYLTPLGITSVLNVPIHLGSVVVGVLCAEHTGLPRHWSLEEQSFASTTAYRVSLALEAHHRAITEQALRTSEKQFRQLTENIREVFFLASPDLSEIYYISPAYEEVWGRSIQSLYQQPSSWLNSVHPEDRTRVFAAVRRHLQGEQVFEEEYRILLPDGLERWVFVRAFLVLNELGVVERTAGLAEDITKRKQAETEILNALAQEKELGDLKSRFVSITSHEFRTPLTTILSTTELLEYYQWSPAETVEQLHVIQDAVNQMLLLLEDTLFIGTADAGELAFHPISLDLHDFCENLVCEIRQGLSWPHSPSVSQSSLMFISQGESFLAQMDRKLLRQILSNLLLNAIKYSPEGGRVRFELICQDNEVIFRIQDWGIGIPLDDQPRLFEFFHRGRNVGAINGTGLGLAIVKKCVDFHGGQIHFDSELGLGTTFTVTLPRFRP